MKTRTEGRAVDRSIVGIHFFLVLFPASERKFSPRKAIEFLVKTYRGEGWRALWRGNSATMVRIVPYAAVQYTAHEQYKMLLNPNPKKK